METKAKARRSIITTYRKNIWRKFISAINEYELIKDGDKIAVCISGGKDSMLLALCFQELFEHGKQNFSLEFLVMDPGYSERNLNQIKHNAEKLGVPIKIFTSNIFEYVAGLTTGSPCYMCARMRRGNLYAFAKELGCNKIALGHHFNDVIETTLLSVLYNARFQTMMPKLKSKNFEGIELIRPLYKVKEKDIINWREANELIFINCACKLLEIEEDVCSTENTSKRAFVKELVAKLKKINPDFDNNIFTSLENVNIDATLGYIAGNKKISFLENYDNIDGVDL